MRPSTVAFMIGAVGALILSVRNSGPSAEAGSSETADAHAAYESHFSEPSSHLALARAYWKIDKTKALHICLLGRRVFGPDSIGPQASREFFGRVPPPKLP